MIVSDQSQLFYFFFFLITSPTFDDWQWNENMING